jgi:hypothetical protein
VIYISVRNACTHCVVQAKAIDTHSCGRRVYRRFLALPSLVSSTTKLSSAIFTNQPTPYVRDDQYQRARLHQSQQHTHTHTHSLSLHTLHFSMISVFNSSDTSPWMSISSVLPFTNEAPQENLLANSLHASLCLMSKRSSSKSLKYS